MTFPIPTNNSRYQSYRVGNIVKFGTSNAVILGLLSDRELAIKRLLNVGGFFKPEGEEFQANTDWVIYIPIYSIPNDQKDIQTKIDSIGFQEISMAGKFGERAVRWAQFLRGLFAIEVTSKGILVLTYTMYADPAIDHIYSEFGFRIFDKSFLDLNALYNELNQMGSISDFLKATVDVNQLHVLQNFFSENTGNNLIVDSLLSLLP